MNKKGFTLVELLAVIAILAIILGIVVINAISLSKKRREIDYNNIKNIVTSSTKAFIDTSYDLSDYIDSVLRTNSSCKIDYSYLVNNRIVDSDLVNPNTNDPLNGYVFITRDSNYKYSYEFKDTLTTQEQSVPNCIN